MKKTNKKISLAILALASVSLGGLAIGNVSASEASAATSLPTLDSFRVEKVSVRLAVSESEENGGFRFESLVSKATYDSLMNVTEVGTLFIPTFFNLDDASLALDASGNVLDEKVEKVVLEGGAENRRGGLVTTVNDVEVISYRAYINDIPAEDYVTELTARSYVIADGVTYYTETVSESVGAVATEAYYDVATAEDEVYCNQVAEGWYSPFTATERAEIGEYVQKATEKTYADQYVLVKDGNATLDLSKISVAAEDVLGVTVDGAFTTWSVDDTTLTYATTVGEKTLTVATANGVYNVALVQADQAITTYEEFNAWTNTNATAFGKYQYTVLANDIKASGTNWFNGGIFNKTFNGLGHTIDGYTGGKGIVHALSSSAVWKNVNYTNFKGDLVLYAVVSGKFENVNITGEVGIYQFNNLLAYTINSNSTLLKNCFFNLNCTKPGTALNIAAAGAECDTILFENTTIIYGNGQLNVPDTVNMQLTNSYLYDVDDVNTDYYAKVSGGTATFALSQMGESAPTTVSKLLVNGVEAKATVADGVLSYPATNTGSTTLMMTTDKGTRIMNIVHADNVLTTWNEFNAWATTKPENGGTYNAYEYTVLANDITASGTIYSNGGHFQKTFDGLGHTIDGFTCGHGIVQRLLAGATWKNVNYTNLKTTGQGLFGYFAGGTFENVNISGTIGSENCIFAYGNNNQNSTLMNCTITVTSADNAEKYLWKGETHYWGIHLVNTTINYTGTINMKCDSCELDAKITNTNSTINSNYVAQ